MWLTCLTTCNFRFPSNSDANEQMTWDGNCEFARRSDCCGPSLRHAQSSKPPMAQRITRPTVKDKDCLTGNSGLDGCPTSINHQPAAGRIRPWHLPHVRRSDGEGTRNATGFLNLNLRCDAGVVGGPFFTNCIWHLDACTACQQRTCICSRLFHLRENISLLLLPSTPFLSFPTLQDSSHALATFRVLKPFSHIITAATEPAIVVRTPE
jgi:hypothetical protein